MRRGCVGFGWIIIVLYIFVIVISKVTSNARKKVVFSEEIE